MTKAARGILASKVADSSGMEKLKEVLPTWETLSTTAASLTLDLVQQWNDDAKRMITEAKDSAVTLGEQKTQEADSKAQNIIAKAQEAAKAERVQMAADLKKEFGRLVVATTTQVSGKVLTQGDQDRINQEALSSVQN